MFLRIHRSVGDFRPFYERGVVHLTQVEATFQQADDMLVNLGLRNQTTLNSLWQTLVSIVEATLYVSTGEDSLGGAVNGIRGTLVVHVEVGDSTAVADDEILEAPFVAQNLLEQSRTAAAWIIIEALVGTHHLTYLCILHQCLKGRHVGLPEITCRNVG